MKRIVFIIILFMLIQGCRKNINITTDTESQISQNVDGNFETFLKLFSKDSVFQLSRIKFPIKVQEINGDDFELIEKTIIKENYKKLNFNLVDSLGLNVIEGYHQKITSDGNKKIVECEGIENGISIEYIFEKIKGKWHLTTWINQST